MELQKLIKALKVSGDHPNYEGTCPACGQKMLVHVDDDGRRRVFCNNDCTEGDIGNAAGLTAIDFMPHIPLPWDDAPSLPPGVSGVQIAKPTARAGDADSINSVNSINSMIPSTHTKLDTITGKALQEKDIPPLVYVVDDMLPQGLSLLAAPSKYGKSWLSLDLCLSVAMGDDFLGARTSNGGTLYLALEDGYRRLKSRMEHILSGRSAPDNFHLATTAATIDAGLTQQVTDFIKEHPDTKLVIVDVLERVRSGSIKGASAYTQDYQNMGVLKHIADENNVCVLVIHHTCLRQPIEGFFNWLQEKTNIQFASKVRSLKGLLLHIFGRLSAALLAFNS